MNHRLPDSVRRAVEAALTGAEREEPGGIHDPAPATLRSVSALGGGCVSPAARIETTRGTAAFVKWNDGAPQGFFHAEAEGLRHLSRAAARAASDDPGGWPENGGEERIRPIRVPEVLGVGEGGTGPGWLLLEFIPAALEERGGAISFGVSLGRGLAALHRPSEDGAPDRTHPEGRGVDSPSYGWGSDNYIGPLPQRNTPRGSWVESWREDRLRPQLQRARDAGFFGGSESREWEALLDLLDTLLEGAEADGASLLHGDFWSGNVYPGESGEPVLIDPAVYRGHREVDLAMAELFGGFPSDFLPAYHEAWPLSSAYARVRRDVYQLYPLLVHVNLFGGGYTARASEKLRTLLRL